jgi:hypothetical protein
MGKITHIPNAPLVGFNYIGELETWRYISLALWIASVVVVGSTAFCLLAWFKDSD